MDQLCRLSIDNHSAITDKSFGRATRRMTTTSSTGTSTHDLFPTDGRNSQCTSAIHFKNMPGASMRFFKRRFSAFN